MKACPEGFSTVGQLIAQRAVVRLAAALVAQRRLAVLLPRSTGQLRCTGGRALVTWLWRAAVVHGRAGRDHRRAGGGGRAGPPGGGGGGGGPPGWCGSSRLGGWGGLGRSAPHG